MIWSVPVSVHAFGLSPAPASTSASARALVDTNKPRIAIVIKVMTTPLSRDNAASLAAVRERAYSCGESSWAVMEAACSCGESSCKFVITRAATARGYTLG